MNKDEVERCLAEYAKRQPVYGRLAEAVRKLLAKLAEQDGVPTQSTEFREKDPERLRQKLSRPTAVYKSLTDVMDLAGVRVITYYSDHVDQIGEIVESEFEILSEHSVDKRKAVEPDRFGYASLHYICKLSPQRLALPEYKEYQGMLLEIQIRTVLQHAWAEIEHDLGYKTEPEVPYHIRRKLSRLAGVLELADEEFVDIRRKREQYRKEVPKSIASSPEKVSLDKVSISELVRSSRLVSEVDDEIAAVPGTKVRPIDDDDCGLLARTLSYVGLESVGQVVSEVGRRKEDILKLGELQLKGKGVASVAAGMSLFYVFLIMLARERDYKGVMEGLNHFLIAHPGDDRPELARLLVQHFGPG